MRLLMAWLSRFGIDPVIELEVRVSSLGLPV